MSDESVMRVDDVPDAFKAWLEANRGRIEGAENLPYFIRDNKELVDGILNPQGSMQGANGSMLGRQENKEAREAYRDSEPPTLSAEQSVQVAALARLFGFSRWSPMPFLSANSGRANLFFGRGGLFAANCQCCVVAHEARLRGLDVTAVGYSEDVESVQYLLGERFQRAWRTAKGKEPQVVRLRARDAERLWAKLESETRAVGRYHIGLNLEDGSGHIITAERFKDGRAYYYDAQSGEFVNIRSFSRVKSLEVLRVDRLLFDGDIVGGILQVI